MLVLSISSLITKYFWKAICVCSFLFTLSNSHDGIQRGETACNSTSVGWSLYNMKGFIDRYFHLTYFMVYILGVTILH